MATISWKNSISDLFSVAADWSSGTVPGAADDAVLGSLTSTAYTVSANSTATVNSLQTAANATLVITSSNFTASNGSGAGVNAGTIAVGDNGTFTVGGNFNNTGAVILTSYNPAHMIIGAATSLTGGGQIQLADGNYAASNALYGATAATTLTNVNNTISGAGLLGAAQLTLINQAAGVIDATGASHQLILNTGANAVGNAGLIEATGAAGLLITGTTIANTSTGVIEANGSGVHVDLNSAVITGGTLKTLGGGYIQTTDRGSVLDGSTSTVNNQGVIDIAGIGTSLSLKGAINNTGALSVTSYNPSQLIIAANTTLTGAGQVTLNEGSYAASNQLFGSTGATTLTNLDNTISGAGQLGAGQLTLINQAAGVINANAASHQLVLNTGSAAVTNSGLIEATGAAGLLIQSTTVNDSTGGVLLANNSVIGLQSATIVSGALKTMGTGSFQTVDRGSVLNGTSTTSKLYVLGNVTVGGSGTSLTIDGTINLTQKIGTVTTNGVITLVSYNASQLITGVKNASLVGSQVVLAEGAYAASNQIIGTLTAGKSPKISHLSNSSTLIGAGAIGSNLVLTNTSKGVIDATGANHALVIATGNTGVANSNIVKNSGLIESTNPTAAASVGGLTISNTIISNSGSTAVIEANGAATHVDLVSATIIGGTLKTLAGGVIQTIDHGSVLDGTVSTVNNQATIVIANSGSALSLKGTINNTGVFSLTSYNAAQLIAAANTTLSGGGAVTLNDGSYGLSNQIYGATGATTLTNVDNVISGAGQLGAGQLTFVNDAAGVVNANGASHQLVINTGSAAVNNSGLIEATGAAGLLITGTTITNTATGVVKAVGSHIDLTSATIAGGTLIASGGDYFQTLDHGSVLDGSTATLNNQATIVIANSGTALSLKGAINNTGVFSITSYNASQLIIATNTTLTGGGAVTLNEGAYAGSNQVYGATGATTLTNTNNVISGAGQLGAGQLIVVNSAAGVIDATGASHALVINTGSVAVTNAGLIEATAAGGLSISSGVANSGTLLANGGNVSVSGGISGSGTDSIKGSSLFEAGAADSNTVSFDAASTGALKLDQSQLFTGTVTGLSTGKTVDLANVAFATATLGYTGTTTSGVLTVTDGSITASIKLTGNYTKANFALANDGSGHTDVTYNGTGMGPSPAVAQLAAAMAAMGASSSAHSVSSSAGQHTPALLLATPHWV